MNSPERIALAALAPQPWKNGAGLTRELAAEPRGASMDDFAWRLSVAEVARDAPFSAFAGVDRCITLLHGAGIHLAGPGIDHALHTRLVPFRFPGDVALAATLRAGACSDFNVMTRRGAWRADVTVEQHGFEPADADTMLLLAVDGAWQVDAGATDHDAGWSLAAGDALLWRRPPGALWAAPLGAGAALLCVRLCAGLCHDPAR